MPLLARRVARVVRRRSLPVAARALRRELWLRREQARLERALRSEMPIVVGPFVGEVGFELLYWRPMVRRLLRRFDVDPARVTVVSRAGAGVWYRDVAGRSLDVLEVMTPEELRRGVEDRVARDGQRKQSDIDAFDRTIVSRLGLEDHQLLHPLHVYWGFRFVWEGLEPPGAAHVHGDYDELEREPAALGGVRLPDRFVAVKTYVNDCLPADPRNRAAVGAAIAQLSRSLDVVVLDTGFRLDDHDEIGHVADGVFRLGEALDVRRNLAQQAEIVARADALLSTYGGFSYLGPFLGVPTVAVSSAPEWNPVHERVLRAVRPRAGYLRVAPEAASDAVTALLAP